MLAHRSVSIQTLVQIHRGVLPARHFLFVQHPLCIYFQPGLNPFHRQIHRIGWDVDGTFRDKVDCESSQVIFVGGFRCNESGQVTERSVEINRVGM